jgi:general secretion pathway protein G
MFGIREQANIDAARGQVGLIYTACDHFRLFMNDYPSNLEQLIVNPGTSSKWSGPYLDTEKLPKDPWGHEYVYEYQQGGKPIIYSLGPDGQPNTADDVHKEEAQ